MRPKPCQARRIARLQRHAACSTKTRRIGAARRRRSRPAEIRACTRLGGAAGRAAGAGDPPGGRRGRRRAHTDPAPARPCTGGRRDGCSACPRRIWTPLLCGEHRRRRFHAGRSPTFQPCPPVAGAFSRRRSPADQSRSVHFFQRRARLLDIGAEIECRPKGVACSAAAAWRVEEARQGMGSAGLQRPARRRDPLQIAFKCLIGRPGANASAARAIP